MTQSRSNRVKNTTRSKVLKRVEIVEIFKKLESGVIKGPFNRNHLCNVEGGGMYLYVRRCDGDTDFLKDKMAGWVTRGQSKVTGCYEKTFYKLKDRSHPGKDLING